MIARIFILFAFFFAAPAMAVDFPPLTGRVVDQAELLNPEQEQQLTQRLEALQRASSRQLVVATVTSLQDLPIEDYGYQLGRAWGSASAARITASSSWSRPTSARSGSRSATGSKGS